MTSREVRDLTTTIANAGHPVEQERERARARAIASAQLAFLDQERRGCEQEYRRNAGAWLSESLPPDAPIMALDTERHQARQYFIAGVIAMAAECGLAWWTFESRW